MYLWEILDNAAASVGERTALVADGERWNFAELADRAESLARRLSELTGAGDRVAVVSHNSLAYVAALYGVPRSGAVLVHGNTRHTADELGSMIARSRATVLLADQDQLERLRETRLPSVSHRLLLDDLTTAVPDGHRSVEAGRVPAGAEGDTAQGDTVEGDTTEGDTAWLMYTSGTTGVPKGVMLTHRSLIAAALNTTIARPVSDDEVYLFPFPLFHVAAYNVIHHHLRQRPVVLLTSFEPLAAMRAIESESVTSVSLAPTMLSMLLEHPERQRFDLGSLRKVSYGAAAMPRALLLRSLSRWPHVGLFQGYGMTELSGNAVFLSPEEHQRAATDDPDLLTAAGRPAPMTALKIVDTSGSAVAAGDRGEILVRGDQVCAGYFEDPRSSASAITGGWLHTGDVGRIDDRGYLHIVDRMKDIIITGGENVSSREVEDAISTHPGLLAVSVIGTPDERWGELVTAVVVAKDPAEPVSVEDLRSACSDLAGFKHPRMVLHQDALPTNASGKVDKVALRKLVTQSRNVS